MKNIVIIGGAGFVGHHLAPALKVQGHNVTCVDSLSVNNLYAARINEDPMADKYKSYLEERLAILEAAGIPLLRLDARDYNLLSRTVSGLDPEIIIHLAAIAHITVAKKEPYDTFDNSLRTLENSLDIARSLDSSLIYFSSSTVYGDFSAPTVDETEERTPKGTYGNLKLAGEALCQAYVDDFDMPITVIRPQALYGPRCVSGRVTQVFVERALMGLPITIHGDGSEKHDFTCIYDLVEGMKLVCGSDWRGLRIYNLTGESATSLKHLAQIVAERIPVKIEYGPKDPDKPSRGTMSCKKIREELGYKPAWDIDSGMSDYISWYMRVWKERKSA